MADILIVDQPNRKLGLNFEFESGFAKLLYGECRTFPVVEVINCTGTILLQASCVTHEVPFRPHLFKLVGDDCDEGCFKMTSNGPDYCFTLSNLGVQRTTFAYIKERAIDPFNTGFDHLSKRKEINFNKLRLSFQVFQVIDTETKQNLIPLFDAIVSDIICIRDIRDLKIIELCPCSAPSEGGTKMILLANKIRSDDIAVIFFAEAEGKIIWHDYVKLSENAVHKKCAITFSTPRYPYEELPKNAKVYVQLERRSSGDLSDPLEFEFIENRKLDRKTTTDNDVKLIDWKIPQELQNWFADLRCFPNMDNVGEPTSVDYMEF